MSKTSALDAFASLGLTDQTVFTKAMALAVKQRWTDLPTDRKVDELRADLAVLEADGPAEVASVLALEGIGSGLDHAEAEKEHARLKRNAAVNHWRARNQIQAALDARDLKFAAMRAKRGALQAVVAAAS
jgi:hypothetical protein